MIIEAELLSGPDVLWHAKFSNRCTITLCAEKLWWLMVTQQDDERLIGQQTTHALTGGEAGRVIVDWLEN